MKEECPNIHTIPLDLTDWNATRLALETLPAMDGLVNNAALAICKPFLDVPPEDIDL